jgi:cytochrome P450
LTLPLSCPVGLVSKDTPYVLSSGVEIRPGDAVFLYLEGVHTDPSIFPNPFQFDPLRWLESDEKTLEKMSSHFFAFGYGSRICPGMYLAQHEGELALAFLAHHFDFELACRPEQVLRIQSFTARPEYLPMRFKERYSEREG